jgi:hypothetical protein
MKTACEVVFNVLLGVGVDQSAVAGLAVRSLSGKFRVDRAVCCAAAGRATNFTDSLTSGGAPQSRANISE